MDAALRLFFLDHYSFVLCVSILVLVDAALRHLNVHQVREMLYMVSILVLVDAALRLALYSLLVLNKSCFNPCFSGCRPATSQRHPADRASSGFQSLF